MTQDQRVVRYNPGPVALAGASTPVAPLARNALPRDQVEQIVAAQASRAQRLAAADLVIFNGAGVTQDALRAQAARLAQTFGL